MELAKQLIGFIAKTICFSQRNLDCGSWFDWLRQKSFAPKCVHLGKNKVFPKRVSHLRFDAQSQKLKNSRYWHLQHDRFLLFFTKTKKSLVWKGENGESNRRIVSLDGTHKTITSFQVHKCLFFSTKPWRWLNALTDSDKNFSLRNAAL